MASAPLADPEAELGYGEIPVERPDDPPVQRMAVHQELDLSTAYRHRHFVPFVVCKPKRKSLHLRRRLMLNLIVESDFVLPATRLQLQVPVNIITFKQIVLLDTKFSSNFPVKLIEVTFYIIIPTT